MCVGIPEPVSLSSVCVNCFLHWRLLPDQCLSNVLVLKHEASITVKLLCLEKWPSTPRALQSPLQNVGLEAADGSPSTSGVLLHRKTLSKHSEKGLVASICGCPSLAHSPHRPQRPLSQSVPSSGSNRVFLACVQEYVLANMDENKFPTVQCLLSQSTQARLCSC